MDFREKQLYHQIHPAKLFTDWSAGFIALYFLWQHNLVVPRLPFLCSWCGISTWKNTSNRPSAAMSVYT